MNIISQSFWNISRSNMMNLKSLRKNDKSNFFVTVLNSLQSLWKSFLHILIEAKRSLKIRYEKNTEIKTSNKWSTFVFFKRILEQSQKKQSDAYLQSTVLKHIDQIDKMKTVEHLYSMLVIFRKTFEFLSNQVDSRAQFHFFYSNIIIFELIYKIVIVMIDIKNVLWKLNVLNSKK